MNKKKLLTILLLALSVLLVGGIIATIVFWPAITGGNSEGLGTVINGTEGDIYNGYADVTLYGAVANDGKDDTSAFLKAAKTGAGVYVPMGTFDINKTLSLKGQNLKGAGMEGSIIRFNGKGAIVKISDTSVVNDITLTFADKYTTGKEKAGEQVAILDGGITSGTKLSCVKIINVGTGYFSNKDESSQASLLAESLIIDGFTYKAVEIKNASATTLRAMNIGKSKASIKSAILLGGSFTLDAVCFNGTECDYALELNNCRSAAINSITFDGVSAKSGSLIKSVSSIMSAKTVTVINSKATTLVKIADASDGVQSNGNVVMLWADTPISADADGIIKCANNISQ